jgi:hypothetical protein
MLASLFRTAAAPAPTVTVDNGGGKADRHYVDDVISAPSQTTPAGNPGVRLLAGESTQARVGGVDEPARQSQDQNGEAPTFAVLWNDTANAPKGKRRIEET